MRSLRFSCAVLASALALPALAEDLTIVSKATGPMGTGGTTTQYFSSSKFRSVERRQRDRSSTSPPRRSP